MLHRNPRIGQELLDVPMGDMIRDMAFAIAEAQIKLDQNSMEVAEMMGGLKTITHTDPDGNEIVTYEDSRVFFGKEKLLTKDAVSAHNASDDLAYKTEIRRELGSGNYEYTNLKNETTLASLPATQQEDAGSNKLKYLFAPAGAAKGWYVWNDTDGEYQRLKATPIDIKIALADGVGPNGDIFVSQRLSMLELGFSPTMYQFVDTIIETKVSIKYSREATASVSVQRTRKDGLSLNWGKNLSYNRNVTTSQVNATYASKYNYSAEGSSLLRTKLVPIPPPAILEERIAQQMELVRQRSGSES